MATATRKLAAKPAAKPKSKPKPAAAKAPELTPIDDGVNIKVGDATARVSIVGTFDLDGLISVVKRLDRARSELS